MPLVILVNGYPDTQIQHLWGMKQKDFQLFVSWGELIAASGMIAVTYETQYSHSETDSLIYFLCKNGDEYNIDKEKIALFGCSANVLAAQSLLQEPDYKFKCAVMYYGIFLTPDLKYYAKIDSAASHYGYYWKDLHEIKGFSPEIPLFIAKAGNDKIRVVKETTDYFMEECLKTNLPVTFINYPDGQHDFDILDDTSTSKAIIKQTVDFLKKHLSEN